MGFFDDIFDFNGDGKTDFWEEWLGFTIINSCMKHEEESPTYSTPFFGSNFGSNNESNDDWSLFCEDGSDYGLYPEDFDTQEEFEDALEEARSAWRDTCEDGSDYGLYPEDFDTQEAFDDALEEARAPSRNEIHIPITFSIDLQVPGYDALRSIQPTDYPNKRQYEAAYHLCDVEQGTAYIPGDSSREAEIEKCKFILSSDTLAGKYLTVYKGFLYAQAIKDNFSLPMEVPDEDEKPITAFEDLFLEIAEEDVSLALQIWVWCIREFGPYQKYMKNDRTLYNAIISSVDDYPEAFLDLAIQELGSNIAFCQGLLTENKQFPHGIARFISRALEADHVTQAQVMFTAAALNPAAKGKDMENLINRILSDCSNWEELETMEKFKFSLLPIIQKMNDKRIRRLLPAFIDQVENYIHRVESSNEKYRYSRKYAWRASCADGSAYGVDPLHYETAEEYNAALQNRKYGWRRRHSEAKHCGIDVNAFETEDAYMEALQTKREEEQAARSAPKPQTDPLAGTDKTIYNFCSVVFNSANQPYTYLTGDVDVQIGDTVVVPVGNAGKEAVATVVSTSQHMRLTAPYPVEKAKKIIKKCQL